MDPAVMPSCVFQSVWRFTNGRAMDFGGLPDGAVVYDSLALVCDGNFLVYR